MKTKIILLLFIAFVSCEVHETTNETESLYLNKTAKYTVTKDATLNFNVNVNDFAQNDLIQFVDGNSKFTIDKFSNTPEEQNTHPSRSFGFLYCFQGDPTEILDCLQNYVGPSEVVQNLDPSIPDNPEGIAIDSKGNYILAMGLSGQLVKLKKNGIRSLITTLPIGEFNPFALTGILGPVAIDRFDNMYVSVNASDPVNRGVWKVRKNGNATLLSNFPMTAALNGLAIKSDHLYVADSSLDGKIWRVSINTGTTEIWADDPLLKISNPTVMAPGPNGIQYYGNEIYVSNPNQNRLLAIELNNDGTSGTIRIAAEVSFDDFAIDILGNVIGTTAPANTIEKVYPDGRVEGLLTAADGLDIPTAAIFGRDFLDSFNLYITNAAFPFVPGATQPSLMKLELGIPGFDRSAL